MSAFWRFTGSHSVDDCFAAAHRQMDCCLAARGSFGSPSSFNLANTAAPSGSDAGLKGRVADLVPDALRPRVDAFEAHAAQSEVQMLNFTDPMRQLACSPDDAMGVIEIDDLTAIDYAPASTVLSGFCTVGYNFYYEVRDIDFVSIPAPSIASGLVCGCIA